MPTGQLDLFAPAPASPPGFRHWDETISPEEERAARGLRGAGLRRLCLPRPCRAAARRVLRPGLRLRTRGLAGRAADPALPARAARARRGPRRPRPGDAEPGPGHRIPAWRGDRLAPRQGRVRRRPRRLARRPLPLPAATQGRRLLATRLAAPRAAVRLPAAGAGEDRMGAQHPTYRRGAAALGDLPHPARRLTPVLPGAAWRRQRPGGTPASMGGACRSGRAASGRTTPWNVGLGGLRLCPLTAVGQTFRRRAFYSRP